MSLGKDIELAAFQDEKMPRFFFPYGAVVRQPVQELGQTAARQLLRRISNPALPAQEIILQADYLPKKINWPVHLDR